MHLGRLQIDFAAKKEIEGNARRLSLGVERSRCEIVTSASENVPIQSKNTFLSLFWNWKNLVSSALSLFQIAAPSDGLSEGEDDEDLERKRREVLARRPSYRYRNTSFP